MYSLDINFLNDREVVTQGGVERQPIADSQFLIFGGAAAVAAIALAAGAYFFVQFSSQGLKGDLATLTQQEQALDAKLKQLSTSEGEIKQVEDRTKALLALFVGDIPPSAILQELRVRTPVNVKITNVSQNGKNLQITGQSASFNEVNDFLLLLQGSPFFDPQRTHLVSSRLQAESPNVKIALIDYQIETTLTDKSAVELLPDLQKAGSEGLVTRIKLLQQKGAIAQ